MLRNALYRDPFFDDFFEPFFKADHKALPSNSLMRTDVKETEAGYALEIDLPGYTKEDVHGEINDGYLTITASKTENHDEQDKDGKYIRRERFSGSCSRSYYVGEDVTEEDIKAKFENGILNVFVPKKDKQPKVEEKKFIAIE